MANQQLSQSEIKEFFDLVERQKKLEQEMEEFKKRIDIEIKELRKNFSESHQKTYEKIDEMVRRMNAYETEMLKVRESILDMTKRNDDRFRSVEGELKGLHEDLKMMNVTLGSINGALSGMSQSQTELVKVQNKTINNLWKAFFAVLTVITTAAGVIFALIGLN